ncbi:aminopeptidase [Elusimicrobium simillimum]|uniref:aminopeptidase n=1 Tax=Elusimicrobium simillimum TaxID=3143438 RepID=UPI003C6EEAD2
MFTDKELQKYAQVLVWALKQARTGKFKKYDSILVRYDAAATTLADRVFEILIKEKFNPVLQMLNSEASAKSFYTYADNTQLKNMPKWVVAQQASLNGLIAIHAPQSLTHLAAVDPKKIALAALAKKGIREILDKREAAGDFGWTLCSFPTEALAKSAGLTVAQYAEQVKKAVYITERDPIAKWQEIFKSMNDIAAWLGSLKIDTINTQSKNMDLTVKLGEQRKFLCARGCNMPSFEIFTSPDWRGTKGTYFANLKSLRSGQIIENIKVEFAKGRVVKAKAAKGEQYLKKMIAMDAGAAQVGEYSLTDARMSKIDRFMADTLFDENFGGKYGNSHIALGSSYADTFAGDVSKLTKVKKKALGYNDSSLHWDIINTEDKIVKATLKNGKVVTIYESGRFKY